MIKMINISYYFTEIIFAVHKVNKFLLGFERMPSKKILQCRNQINRKSDYNSSSTGDRPVLQKFFLPFSGRIQGHAF